MDDLSLRLFVGGVVVAVSAPVVIVMFRQGKLGTHELSLAALDGFVAGAIIGLVLTVGQGYPVAVVIAAAAGGGLANAIGYVSLAPLVIGFSELQRQRRVRRHAAERQR